MIKAVLYCNPEISAFPSAGFWMGGELLRQVDMGRLTTRQSLTALNRRKWRSRHFQVSKQEWNFLVILRACLVVRDSNPRLSTQMSFQLYKSFVLISEF